MPNCTAQPVATARPEQRMVDLKRMMNELRVYQVCRFQGGEHSECDFLGYGTVKSGRLAETFRTKLLPQLETCWTIHCHNPEDLNFRHVDFTS
jgi:hypothetical protein